MVNMPAAVRGTSAGELRSGGNASVAVRVIAVVKPTSAAQTRSQRGMREDQAEERRQAEPARTAGTARRGRCSRLASNSRTIGATICAPLSQASAGAKQVRLALAGKIVAEKGVGAEERTVVAAEGEAEQPDQRDPSNPATTVPPILLPIAA